jgi:hypothetical protein
MTNMNLGVYIQKQLCNHVCSSFSSMGDFSCFGYYCGRGFFAVKLRGRVGVPCAIGGFLTLHFIVP